jgi:hypothetical protein
MSIERLYKYGRLGPHSEALFSGSQVWWAPAADLNDPFECCPCFTYQGTEEEIFALIVTGFRKRNPQATHKQALGAATEVYRERRHCAAGFWEAMTAQVIGDLRSKIGLYCLAEGPDSILMWSHYALDHKGYCLEFEANDQTVVFGEAQKVQYSELYPHVDFFNTPNDIQVDRIFLTKHSGWAYEQEWRIIDHQRGLGLRDYPAQLLKTVIFGLRMPEANRDQIRSWVSRRGHPVKFCRAVQNRRKFSIHIEEIK